MSDKRKCVGQLVYLQQHSRP